jgi:putative two-component system response regulator
VFSVRNKRKTPLTTPRRKHDEKHKCPHSEAKCTPDTPRVCSLFLTGNTDTGSELDGLSLGAVDYITKPFVPSLLLKRLEVHLENKRYSERLQEMVDEKTREVVVLQDSILQIVAELVERRDDVTGSHIERTQNGVRILIEALLEESPYKDECAGWDINLMLSSSQLHDVGKIQISDVILNKPAKLDDAEFAIMKKHATYGEEIINRIEALAHESEFIKYAKIFAATHHERWDGKGYPKGLSGINIPLPGRIMAVADVYDALTSERPYKKAFTHGEASGIIKEGRGTQFDPVLVDVFARVAEKFNSTEAA